MLLNLLIHSVLCHNNEIYFRSLKLNSTDFNVTVPADYSMFFQASDKIRMTIFSGSEQKVFTVYKDQYIKIHKANAILRAFKNELVNIYIWKIPINLCGSANTHYSADKFIKFSSENTQAKNNFCIFPQSNAYSHEIYGNFQTAKNSCKLNFYSVGSIHLNIFQDFREMKNKLTDPVYIAHPNHSFKLDFSSPYFMQYTGCSGSNLKMEFSSKVERLKQSSADCNVYSMPSINMKGGFKSNNPLGFVNIDKCQNKSEDVVISLFVISTVFLVFSVLMLAMIFIPEKSPFMRFRIF